MLADPRARRGLHAFADDWLELDALREPREDPTTFPYFSPDVGNQPVMRPCSSSSTSSLRVTRTSGEDGDANHLRDPSPRGRTGSRPPDTFAKITLPEDGVRAGLLGHASVLALHASPNRSSPTLRGSSFESASSVSMPSPPANVDTTIPEGSEDAPTMRERLEVHLSHRAAQAATCSRI